MEQEKLHFNHPLKEIYPFLTQDEIKNCFIEIRKNPLYETGEIPSKIFDEYVRNLYPKKALQNTLYFIKLEKLFLGFI
jgi:hypothetical protein